MTSTNISNFFFFFFLAQPTQPKLPSPRRREKKRTDLVSFFLQLFKQAPESLLRRSLQILSAQESVSIDHRQKNKSGS